MVIRHCFKFTHFVFSLRCVDKLILFLCYMFGVENRSPKCQPPSPRFLLREDKIFEKLWKGGLRLLGWLAV